MFFRTVVDLQPKYEPHETNGTGHQEGRLPAEGVINRRDGRWRQNCADVRARIKNAGGKGPFPFGEPFGNRFDRRWKIRGFTQSQRGPSQTKTEGGIG